MSKLRPNVLILVLSMVAVAVGLLVFSAQSPEHADTSLAVVAGMVGILGGLAKYILEIDSAPFDVQKASHELELARLAADGTSGAAQAEYRLAVAKMDHERKSADDRLREQMITALAAATGATGATS